MPSASEMTSISPTLYFLKLSLEVCARAAPTNVIGLPRPNAAKAPAALSTRSRREISNINSSHRFVGRRSGRAPPVGKLAGVRWRGQDAPGPSRGFEVPKGLSALPDALRERPPRASLGVTCVADRDGAASLPLELWLAGQFRCDRHTCGSKKT